MDYYKPVADEPTRAEQQIPQDGFRNRFQYIDVYFVITPLVTGLRGRYMQPSRRTALELLGTATLVPISGCSMVSGGDPESESPTQSPMAESDAGFEVRLDGPDTEQVLFDGSDIRTVDSVQEAELGEDDNTVYFLPITLTEEATAAISEIFRTAGVDGNPDEFEIVHLRHGEEIRRLQIAPALAESIANGEWNGELNLTFDQREKAADLREELLDNDTE